MPAALDLTGQRFGRLIVLRRSKRHNTKSVTWECRCDCGKKTYAQCRHLKMGEKKSCGCLHLDVARARFTVHGGARTRLYWSWFAMKQRCSNKRHKAWPRYGGRGIKVCPEWQAFAPFRNWALRNGYKEGLTVDRVDNDGGYEPGNCQWITRRENVLRGSLVRWANHRVTAG